MQCEIAPEFLQSRSCHVAVGWVGGDPPVSSSPPVLLHHGAWRLQNPVEMASSQDPVTRGPPTLSYSCVCCVRIVCISNNYFIMYGKCGYKKWHPKHNSVHSRSGRWYIFSLPEYCIRLSMYVLSSDYIPTDSYGRQIVVASRSHMSGTKVTLISHNS